MRALVCFGVTAAVVLGACSREGESNTSPTVPSSISTTSTTPVPAVSVIPEVIDEAYLNAVLAALDAVNGAAVRTIVATKNFPPDAADHLNAIYSDEEFQIQAEAWLTALAKDRQLSLVKSDPPNRKTTVRRIISASHECVWMEVERRHFGSPDGPTPPTIEYVALHPLDRSNDPRKLNPTAWMIAVEGYNQDGSEPGNACEGS